jgi:hypothetical protein
MLIESSTEWILNQSYEFKVMNSLSTPRPKTRMNIVDILSHASTSKRMRTHMHSTEYWFSMVQNSSGGVDEWGGVDSLH